MLVRIRNLELLNSFYKEKFTAIYSYILDIINLTVFEHFGEVVSFDYDKIFCLWDNIVKNKIRDTKSFKKDKQNFDECKVFLK